MIFENGFEYEKIKYGWLGNRLFRLSYTNNGRTFSIREIKPRNIKHTTCYVIRQKSFTRGRLLGFTKKVDWVEDILEEYLPYS